MPSIDTTIVTAVPDRLRAGMMGMRTSVLRLGQTVGPISCTYLAETVFETLPQGSRLLLVGGAVILVLGVGAYPYLRRT